MRLESLNEFVIIAKHLNFTKAAQELYTSQPALSARINAMEKELGYPLFERSRSKVALTEAGSVLLEYAQKMLALYDDALKKGKAAASELPPVRVSSVDQNSDMGKKFMQQKEIKYTFVDLGINTDPIYALQKDIVDVSLGVDYSTFEEYQEEARDLGISYQRSGEAACWIHVMADHPLAAKKQLSRKDLDGQEIVIHSGSHFDKWSRLLRRVLGEDIKLTFRINHIDTISNLALVDFGDSIYICGGDDSRQVLSQRDDIVTFDKLDGEALLYPTALICRTEDIKGGSTAVCRFVEEFSQ